jgi:hypothetical protein
MKALFKLMDLNIELVELYREYVAEHGFTEEAYEATKKGFAQAFETTCKRIAEVKSISDMSDKAICYAVEQLELRLLDMRAEIDRIGKEELAPS